jgi:hypothetical protein
VKSFLSFFNESNHRGVVIAYGRYNPPTIGHEKLISIVEKTATNKGFDAFIVPSHTIDSVKNPLNFDEKAEILSQLTTSAKIDSNGKSLINLLTHLQSLGYTHVVHVAGSDRIPEFEALIKRYNGQEDKKGNIPFYFKDYTFQSAGERDPDSEGVEGMSASKLRSLAKEGKMDEFKEGMSAKLSDDMKTKVYNIIRERIK